MDACGRGQASLASPWAADVRASCGRENVLKTNVFWLITNHL